MLLVGALLRFGSIAAWVFHIIVCMGYYYRYQLTRIPYSYYYRLVQCSGCLGCDKAQLTSAYHETFKIQSNHFRKSSKPSPSDDFWTASPCGVDNSTNGSISSTSMIPVHDVHGAGCSNNPSEYVNTGLILWHQTRQNWIECKKPNRRSRQLLEPKLSWNDTYDSVLGSNKPFRKPVPLSEMVDFLVDIWEQDGLYD